MYSAQLNLSAILQYGCTVERSSFRAGLRHRNCIGTGKSPLGAFVTKCISETVFESERISVTSWPNPESSLRFRRLLRSPVLELGLACHSPWHSRSSEHLCRGSSRSSILSTFLHPARWRIPRAATLPCSALSRTDMQGYDGVCSRMKPTNGAHRQGVSSGVWICVCDERSQRRSTYVQNSLSLRIP